MLKEKGEYGTMMAAVARQFLALQLQDVYLPPYNDEKFTFVDLLPFILDIKCMKILWTYGCGF